MTSPTPVSPFTQLSLDDISKLLGQRDIVIYQLQQENQRLQAELTKAQEQLAEKG